METRILGGESKHRGWFGGKWSTKRVLTMGATAAAAMLLLIMFRFVGLFLAVAILLVAYVATMETGKGNWWGGYQSRRAWKERKARGLTTFRPVKDRPDYLLEEGKSKAERVQLNREYAAYRDFPDGMDGFHWLQKAPGLPGIGWHTPTGEDAWLSVVWQVGGQVQGIRGDDYLERGMRAFSRLLARYGSPRSLPSRVQIITRVMPVDPSLHQSWAWQNIDPEAPADLIASYDELVRKVGNRGLIQRHYVVIRWPITPEFTARAGDLAEGLAGWRELMADQVATTTQHLQAAMLGQVRVLSAAGVAGVVRHMQLPNFPADQVADVDVDAPWLPTQEWLSAVAVTAQGPNGISEQWMHRTAVIPVSDVETSPRTPLWTTPMLSQLRDQIVRTWSVQIEVQPSMDAREAARDDMTSDLAELAAQREKGVLTDEELLVARAAVDQRLADLRPGSGHAGVGWAAHITISARTGKELRAAMARMESAAEEAGIAKLAWLDGQQGAAMSCTWPFARGMRPISQSTAARLRGWVGGSLSEEVPDDASVVA